MTILDNPLLSPSVIRRIVVPEPPSANRYWRVVNGRMLLSRDARAYRTTVAGTLVRARVVPIEGPVALRAVWRKAARRGDLENRTKQLFDALQSRGRPELEECALFADDSQIEDYRFSCVLERGCTPTVEIWAAPRHTPEAHHILGLDLEAAL